MTMSDPIADMLTRIRNGQRARLPVVECPASKLRASLLEVLKSEGYIRGYRWEDTGKGKAKIYIELKYHEGEPTIREIARVSKPGRRVYTGIKDLQRVYGGLGIAILSTPNGLMSDAEARKQNVGGEVMCQVF